MNNTEEELKKFSQIMWGVAEDFGGTLSDNGLMMKFNALQEYSIEQISQAASWLLKHREKSFPAVPTTKEIIDAIQNVAGGGCQNAAEVQADLVLKKLRNEGGGGKCDFDDPVTQHLMSVRWPYQSWAANVLEKELVWWRKEFIEAYRSYAKQPETINQQVEPCPKVKTLLGGKRQEEGYPPVSQGQPVDMEEIPF